MLNMFTVVGRLNAMLNNTVVLKVQDTTKNEDGVYTSYQIVIEITGNILDNMKEYCHIGDLVGVKGKITNGNVLVAEKVTFLSSKTNND